MKTEHGETSKQPEMEIEKKVVSQQPNQSEDIGVQRGSTWIRSVWTFCLQHKILAAITCVGVFLGGIGALLSGIAEMRSNSFKPEDIIKIPQAVKFEETLEVEKSLQKVERDPKTSIVDKAITQAYRLQEAGKITKQSKNGVLSRW